MKAKTIAILLTSIVAWTIFWMWLFAPIPEKNDLDIDSRVKSAYLSTCKVEVSSEDNSGTYAATGVLLKTGFVITAAHCIDVNYDMKISDNERKPLITFSGSIASVHTGHTIYVGDRNKFDIAIIQLENPPPSNVVLSDTKFGQRLFTIGMTDNGPHNISTGLASTDANGHARASIAAWKGNSGGGIWTNRQELAGIVSRIKMINNPAQVFIPVKVRGGTIMYSQIIQTMSPLSNWLWYSNREEILRELGKKNLAFTCEAIVEEPDYYVYNLYCSTAIQILLVLFCVSVFRKQLFS